MFLKLRSHTTYQGIGDLIHLHNHVIKYEEFKDKEIIPKSKSSYLVSCNL